jgi:hypothetical protein
VDNKREKLCGKKWACPKKSPGPLEQPDRFSAAELVIHALSGETL